MKQNPRHKPGPDVRPDRPGMAEALRALDLERRPPTEADRPPTSLFPMTRGAREALRLKKDLY